MLLPVAQKMGNVSDRCEEKQYELNSLRDWATPMALPWRGKNHWNAIYAGCCAICSTTISHFRGVVWWHSWRLGNEMPSGDGARSQMGELEGQSSPEVDVLPLVGLWQDYLMVCLIVFTNNNARSRIYLFIYYELGSHHTRKNENQDKHPQGRLAPALRGGCGRGPRPATDGNATWKSSGSAPSGSPKIVGG